MRVHSSMVEQQPFKLLVPGSSPGGLTKLSVVIIVNTKYYLKIYCLTHENVRASLLRCFNANNR